MPKTEQKKVQIQAEYLHQSDQSNFDILQRLSGWCDFEDSNLIDELPHLGAVIEFWQLITQHYDVDASEDAVESILEGTSDFDHWNEFVDKYDLQKQGWTKFQFVVTETVKGQRKDVVKV